MCWNNVVQTFPALPGILSVPHPPPFIRVCVMCGFTANTSDGLNLLNSRIQQNLSKYSTDVSTYASARTNCTNMPDCTNNEHHQYNNGDLEGIVGVYYGESAHHDHGDHCGDNRRRFGMSGRATLHEVRVMAKDEVWSLNGYRTKDFCCHIMNMFLPVKALGNDNP